MRHRDKVTLEDSGFVLLPDLIAAAKLERLSTAYDSAMSRGSAPDLRRARDNSSIRLANLIEHEAEFDSLLTLEPVIKACELVIGQRYKLSGLRARTVLPGARKQGLHVDVAADHDGWPLLGFIIMVDRFRNENGATRFVPGSHKWAREWADAPSNHRPDPEHQVTINGAAGSVIVYNGSTWHGHGANMTATPRRSIHGAYIPRNGTSATNWQSLPREVIARLPGAARQLLA